MEPQNMLLTSNAYLDRLCLEDVDSCNIISARFCYQKRNLLAVAHVLIAVRHSYFYAESKASQTGQPRDVLTRFFVSLVAEKLQLSLCLIKYVTLRRVQESKRISRIRQLGPTERWW